MKTQVDLIDSMHDDLREHERIAIEGMTSEPFSVGATFAFTGLDLALAEIDDAQGMALAREHAVKDAGLLIYRLPMSGIALMYYLAWFCATLQRLCLLRCCGITFRPPATLRDDRVQLPFAGSPEAISARAAKEAWRRQNVLSPGRVGARLDRLYCTVSAEVTNGSGERNLSTVETAEIVEALDDALFSLVEYSDRQESDLIELRCFDRNLPLAVALKKLSIASELFSNTRFSLPHERQQSKLFIVSTETVPVLDSNN